MGGNKDNIKEISEEYVDFNPAVEYSIIPGTCHLPQLEKPADVLNNISTFLS